MIDALPSEASLRYVIEVIRVFSRFLDDESASGQVKNADRKRMALAHMEELRQQYPIPKDYDYEQARRDATEERYLGGTE